MIWIAYVLAAVFAVFIAAPVAVMFVALVLAMVIDFWEWLFERVGL